MTGVAPVLSITLLPALVSLLPLRFKAQLGSSTSKPAMERFADFVIGQRRRLLIIITASSLALIAFIPTLKLSKNAIRYYADVAEQYAASRLRRLSKPQQWLHAICFVYHRYQQIMDNIFKR